MPRIKVKVERGNGLQQVITVDTEATKGATLGTDVRLPSGAVATPATFLQWLGTTPGSSSGSGSSSGPSLSSILTTKGDLATRDTQVQRLGIGTQDQALRVSASGMPEWRSGAALTKTDDTNVTLTLGGSPTTSLLAAASLTLGWTGQLGETRGGTAQSGYLQGDILYASALNTLSKLGIGASGRWLGSSGSAPQWNAPAALTKTDDTNVTLSLGGSPTTALLNAASLTLGWTGQLGETRGGTAQSGYLTGDILYASALNTLSKLGIGSSGNVLTVAGGVPTWAAPTGGASGANPTASVGLTAVNGSAGTFMRSDGAPALDQGIAPTWTDVHKFMASGGTYALLGTTNVNANPAGAEVAHLFELTNNDTTFQVARISTYGSTSLAGQNNIHFVRARGTEASPTAVKSGDLFLSVGFRGNDGSAMTGSAGALIASATQDWTSTAHGLKLVLELCPDGGTTRRNVVDFAAAAITFGNSTDLPITKFLGTIAAGGSGQNGLVRFDRSDGATNLAYIDWVSSGDIFRFNNNNGGPLSFRVSGTEYLRLLSDGRLYGTALHNNAGAVTGTANQYIASGTYTPTLTAVANSASRTAYTMQWIRVGNVVTVSGMFDAAATTGATQVKIGMTLPIASSLSAQEQLGGGGASTGQGVALGNVAVAVYADATNDRAELRFLPPNTTVENYMVSFSYLVI